MEWLSRPGLPVWGEMLTVFVVFFAVGLIFYQLGFHSGMLRMESRIEDELDKILLRRRNALADRGRTTERRPEHEGAEPSRNARVRVTSRRVPRPDHPGDQRQ